MRCSFGVSRDDFFRGLLRKLCGVSREVLGMFFKDFFLGIFFEVLGKLFEGVLWKFLRV